MASTMALLIAFHTPGQVSAQLTPSITSDPRDIGIEFMGQDSANPVQNSTGANITQLATVPATAQPITPAAFAPVSEVSDDSSSNDGDDSDSSSNDNDNDSGDAGNDNDSGDGGNDNDNDSGDDGNDNDSGDDGNDNDGGSSSSASAGAGGAFASAG